MTQRPDPESEAIVFFEHLGLTVERIGTGDRKTPDLRVLGDGPGYLVEVKARYDDASAEGELRSGRVASHQRSLGYEETVARIARRARKQLWAEDPERERIWMLWLDARAILGSDGLREQLVGTLYGIRHAVFEDEAGAASLHCYYARPGVFERWPELDLAVVAERSGWLLCLNELSNRVADVRTTRLVHQFAARSAVVEPSHLERAGKAMVVPTTLDRRSDQVLTAYLRERYEHPELMVIDFQQTVAAVEVPRETKPPAAPP